MRILVTGATGFLGSWLTADLAQRDHKLVRLIRDRTYIENGVLNRVYGMTDVFGDVMDLPLIERAMAEYEIDCIVHLAAQAAVSTGQADPTSTFDINVRGTWNVLEAARRQKVARVVVAGSDKGYGPSKVLPYTEETPLSGRSPYEVSKSCADLMAQTYAATYGMSVAITRCSNLYGGGHLTWSTLIPGTIKKLWNRERPVLFGGGQMIREFLYVEDAVRAYVSLIESDQVGAFNFGGGEPVKIVDVVTKIAKMMYVKVDPEIRDGNRGEIQDQYLDSSKAARLLGWKPEVTFDDGLKRTIDWFEDFFISNRKRVCI